MTVTANPEFRSEFLRRFAAEREAEGEAKGLAEGEAKALLTVLATRDISVPDAVRARILACTDLEELETWIGRAVTASSVDELFKS